MKNTESLSIISEPEKYSIVVVDDLPDNLRLLSKILSENGYRVRPASNGARALATISKEPPDLILLDIMMPDMDGYEVCRQLKEDEHLQDIPVIFLSALNDVSDKVKAFNTGGIDFISKPLQLEEVLVRVKTHLTIRSQQNELARMNEKLKQLASLDPLTGLSNRRDFFEKTRQEEHRIRRGGNSMTLILLDIDHFKRVNDTYGHDCGDAVLKTIAVLLRDTLRAQDIIARWGGEEFICLLPDTTIEGAQKVAEKLRIFLEKLRIQNNGDSVAVTATFGLAIYDVSRNLNQCINDADKALYLGKEQGRNRVVFFPEMRGENS